MYDVFHFEFHSANGALATYPVDKKRREFIFRRKAQRRPPGTKGSAQFQFLCGCLLQFRPVCLTFGTEFRQRDGCHLKRVSRSF
jgi:hypothetical protein